MRNIIWLIALFILLLIQGGILLPLHLAPVNLILIVVALATILSDFKQGLIITILGGLLMDFVSGSPDGLITMSLLIVFLILHLILKEFLSREPNRFILVATVASGTILFYFAFLVVDQLFGIIHLAEKSDVRYLLSVQLPLAVMWNLIFSYPVFQYYFLTQSLASRMPTHEEPIRT
ncbi:MAG TPA: hypothetical protein VF974_02655 [Patescibacteria group bacterium]